MIWVAVALLVYLAILALAVRVSLYPIRSPIFLSPGAMGVPQEDVEFASADGTPIRGWWVRHPNPKGVAVLIHGYLMNRSELTPLAARLHAFGWASLIIDLRAHGKSGGKKSSLGVHERHDVAAAANGARAAYPDAKVVLIGSSMGAAAGAFALADDPGVADGIVLDSGFSRLPDAVLGWWYFVGGQPLRALLWPTVPLAAPFVGFNPYKVDVGKALESVKVPVLIIHGDADTLAHPDQARRNQSKAGDHGETVWFEHCGHSEARWVQPDRYYEAVETFLAKVAGDSSSRP